MIRGRAEICPKCRVRQVPNSLFSESQGRTDSLQPCVRFYWAALALTSFILAAQHKEFVSAVLLDVYPFSARNHGRGCLSLDERRFLFGQIFVANPLGSTAYTGSIRIPRWCFGINTRPLIVTALTHSHVRWAQAMKAALRKIQFQSGSFACRSKRRSCYAFF